MLFRSRDRQVRREFGGSARLGVSLLVEQLFSVLLAPSMMLFHSVFVAQTLLGRSVSWNAQSRTDRGVTLVEAFKRQWWHLALGVVWGAIMLHTAPQFFWWLTPVLAGLISSIWLTVWTSGTAAGERLRRWGLLLTPEETAPPPELLRLRQADAEILLPAPAAAGNSVALPPITLRQADPRSEEHRLNSSHEIPSRMPSSA